MLRATPGAALGISTLVLPSAAAHATGGGSSGDTALELTPYLSTDGRAAQDGVAAGDLFVVTQADYDAVESGLQAAGYTVSRVGMSDDRMAVADGNWGATTASTLTTAVWPAGAFLLGGTFGLRPDLSHTVRILRSAFPTGSYTAVGAGAAVPSGSSRVHVLRRDPLGTATAAYLGCVGPTGATTADGATTYYAVGSTDVDGVATWTAWTAHTGRPVRQQYLVAVPA